MNAVAAVDLNAVRDEWIEAASSLLREIAAWASEQGWVVSQTLADRNETALGHYQIPVLTLQNQRRALMIEPVGREVMGATGRVDIYAYPTLFRVMLLRSGTTGEWRIRTDSGIFLDRPWNKETFLSLASDLSASG